MAYYGGYGGYGGFPPYVPVAARRARALAAAAQFAKGKGRGKNGKPARVLSPVAPMQGNKIARSFWGQAWCDNLESYSDYENRLPRGRSYVRHGCVADLQIGRGRVTALVSGSDLYEISIAIKPLPTARWDGVTEKCAGQIDSLVALLQGSLPDQIMEVVTSPDSGLFPSPREIALDCSCPDWADMCKHVAAALYGVGARLDEKPELLFELRGVDHLDLLGGAAAAATRGVAAPAGTKVLDRSDLSSVFGIEIDTAPRAPTPKPAPAASALRGLASEPSHADLARPTTQAPRRGTTPRAERSIAAPAAEARTQARRLQGEYMGTMRLLSTVAKLLVKTEREKKGVVAAIKLARQLAREERASRTHRQDQVSTVAAGLRAVARLAMPKQRQKKARKKARKKPRPTRRKLTSMSDLIAGALRIVLRQGRRRR